MSELLRAISLIGEKLLKSSVEESIDQVLETLGKVTRVSRVYIFFNSCSEKGEILTSQAYEWVSQGITPQIDNPQLQQVPYVEAGYKRWLETLSRGEPILGHIREFPESERELLEAQDIKSILVLPIFGRRRWLGFIGFDECRQEREWKKEEIEILKSAAAIIGAAVERERAYRKLSMINSLIKELAGSLELREIFRKTLDESLRILEAPFGAIMLHSPRSMVVEKLPGESFFNALLKLVGEVKEPLFLENISSNPVLSSLELEGARSAVVLPVQGKLVSGLMAYFFPCRQEFDETDRQLFLSLSDAVSQIVSNAVLFRHLEISERKYLSFLEAARDAVFVHDNGTLLYANSSAVRLLGYSSLRELLEKNFYELIHPRFREELKAKLDKLTFEGESLYLPEVSLLRKDGSTVEVEMTLAPFRFERQTFLHVLARDITGRKKEESFKLILLKQFFETQRQESLSFLTSQMASFFQNIFAALRGLISLAKGSRDQQELESYFSAMGDILKKADSYLASIISTTSRLRPRREKVDLNNLLREITSGFSALLPSKVALHLSFNGGLPLVRGDYYQLQRLLLNLLLEARKGIGEDGEIDIDTVRIKLEGDDIDALTWKSPDMEPGDYICITIKGSFAGLEKNLVDFMALPSGPENQLGFYVVLNILKQHGGGLDIMKDKEEVKLKIYLPAAAG